VRIDIRWSGPNIADINRHAAELVALGPDIILARGAGPVGAVLQATRTVPIVFPVAGDPVGAGLVGLNSPVCFSYGERGCHERAHDESSRTPAFERNAMADLHLVGSRAEHPSSLLLSSAPPTLSV
jgi:hypothetical protein